MTAHPPSPQVTATTALPTGRHIVCFWKQSDLGLFGRRPDRWITHWAQDPQVQSVLIFESPVSAAQQQQWQQLAQQPDTTSASEFALLLAQWQAKRQGQLDTHKLRYPQYQAPPGQPAVGAHYLQWVLHQVRAAGITSPTVVLWPACFVNTALIQAMAPSQIVVDLVDDQRLFPGNESQIGAITDQYRTLIALADQCLSNSPGLIASFEAEFGHPIRHMPNSLWPMMAEPHPASAPVQQRLRAMPRRPVVGYTGNLRGRLDTDTLLPLITRHPEWDFWFVGQTHGSAFYRASQHLPNAHFWGTLCQADAQAVMARYDAAIIPFKDDPLVRSMSPIKVDAYRRAQAPIVSLLEHSPASFEHTLRALLQKKSGSDPD